MDAPNPQLANIKAYLFEFVAHIEKVKLSINFPCTLKVTWKRGTQKTETKQDASLNKGEAKFDSKLTIESNLYFDIVQKNFLEKKSTFTVVIATDKGSKVAGVATLDLGKLAGQQKQEVELDLKLEKCPDKTASLKLKVALRMIKEVDFSNMSQVSSSSVTHTGNLLMSDQAAGGAHHDTVVQHSSNKHYERKLSSIKEESDQPSTEIVQTHQIMESPENNGKQTEAGVSGDLNEQRGLQKEIIEIERSEIKQVQSDQNQTSVAYDEKESNQKINELQERLGVLEVENQEKNRLINELKSEIVVKCAEITERALKDLVIKEQQLREEFTQIERSRAKQYEIESQSLKDTNEKLKQETQAARESSILQANEIANAAQRVQQSKEDLGSCQQVIEQQRLQINASNKASEEIIQKLQKDYEVVQAECTFLKEKIATEQQRQHQEGTSQVGQIDKLLAEIEKLKMENENQRKEHENNESNMEQLKKNFELELEKEKQVWNRQIQELNEQLQGLAVKGSEEEQSQKSIYLKEIQELNDQISTLQEKNQELSHNVLQKDQEKLQLQEHQVNVERLEQDKQDEQVKYQKFNLDIQVLQDECEKYKSQIQTIQSEKHELQEERDTMKLQYVKIKEEKDALHEENKVIQADNYGIKNELERINLQQGEVESGEIEKWKNQVDRLKEQLVEQEEKARRDQKVFKEEMDEKQKEFINTLSQQSEQFRQLLEEKENIIKKGIEDRHEVNGREDLRKKSQDQDIMNEKKFSQGGSEQFENYDKKNKTNSTEVNMVNQEMVIRELKAQHQQEISHLTQTIQDLQENNQQQISHFTQTIQDLQMELNDSKSQKNQILLEMEKIQKNLKNSKQDHELLQLLQDSLLSAKQKLGDIYNTALQYGGMELLEKLQNC